MFVEKMVQFAIKLACYSSKKKKAMRPILYSILLSLTLGACQELDPMTVDPNFELFTRSNDPVFESPLDLAADPSIIRSGDSLLMYYSAENFTIGVAVSVDNGATWSIPGGGQVDYPALRGSTGGWDQTLETIDVLKVEDEYWMYYTGYVEGGDDNGGTIANYEIGLAISTNGLDFVRHPQSIDGAILGRDVSNNNTDDRHAMTSPGVVFDNGSFYMIYAGWNVHNGWTGPNAGIRLIGATSSDGINWTKISKPIIAPAEVTYSPDINEASLIKADDYWYIPFSTGSSIGIARSKTFEGPYSIYPAAIVNPEFSWDGEVTAPDGIIEDGEMKLWYHGVSAPNYWPWVIGYSSAEYPLDW